MKQNLQTQFLPPVTPPTLDTILQRLKTDIFSNLNCHKVGVIQEFNADNQTATIQLVDTWTIPTYSGSAPARIAPLVCVPVIVLKGASGGLTYPINLGDNCLVLFNDRNLDNWQSSGGIQTPATPRLHSITDAVAIVGLYPANISIPNYNNSATELDYISGGDRQAVISLDSKVGISNTSESLKTLITNLINAVLALQVVDPISGNLSITAATTTALNNVQTQFNALLK